MTRPHLETHCSGVSLSQTNRNHYATLTRTTNITGSRLPPKTNGFFFRGPSTTSWSPGDATLSPGLASDWQGIVQHSGRGDVGRRGESCNVLWGSITYEWECRLPPKTNGFFRGPSTTSWSPGVATSSGLASDWQGIAQRSGRGDAGHRGKSCNVLVGASLTHESVELTLGMWTVKHERGVNCYWRCK